ncbi:MAG: hypothetical protein WCA35_10830 [Kovacikia sp.]
MQKPESVKALENLGRERLSKSFFMRDFLYSEVANFYQIQNIPENPDLAIANGKRLCEELLEPLQATFGRINIRSGYRSPEVNRVCNEKNLGCARNEVNFAGHIWDYPDKTGHGAMACIVVNWYCDRYEQTGEWQPLAWWIHDHLPYSTMEFFPNLCAFNIGWHEKPQRRIDSYIEPKGCLTKRGMENHEGDHSKWYAGFPSS